MGSSQHSPIEHDEKGSARDANHFSNFKKQINSGSIGICRQYGFNSRQHRQHKYNNQSGNDRQARLRWEGGLKATGGALVPEKSFVYPIDFKFDNSGKVWYKSVEEINAHFEVPNKDDKVILLRELEPSSASETLRVFLAPDGSNNAAKAALLEKSKFWSELIHKGHLMATDVI